MNQNVMMDGKNSGMTSHESHGNSTNRQRGRNVCHEHTDKSAETTSESASCGTQSSMRDLLTVVIQTSPIPSHPSTALLEALFRSFQNYAEGVLQSRVVVLADGYEKVIAGEVENNKHGKVSNNSALRYQEHLVALRAKIERQEYPFVPHGPFGSIELVELPYRHGSARGIRAAFFDLEEKCQVASIDTPFVMIGQHDNFFVRHAPIEQVVRAWNETPGLGVGANCVHFLSTSTMNYLEKIHKRYNLSLQAKDLSHLPACEASGALPNEYSLVPLVFWYGRTHISTANYFREVIFGQKCPNLQPKDHLEELLGPTELADILERGPFAQAEWGTYVLQPKLNDKINSQTEIGEVLYHLSGRRARATTPEEEEERQRQPEQKGSQRTEGKSTVSENVNSTIHSSKQTHGISFTQARSCKAIVTGLTILASEKDSSTTTNSSSSPKKFKQKCFHCGRKGHSFKFCPENQGDMAISSETIDLS